MFVYVFVCVCLCVCLCAFFCVCLFVCLCVCVYVLSVYVCVFVCACMCVYSCVTKQTLATMQWEQFSCFEKRVYDHLAGKLLRTNERIIQLPCMLVCVCVDDIVSRGCEAGFISDRNSCIYGNLMQLYYLHDFLRGSCDFLQFSKSSYKLRNDGDP